MIRTNYLESLTDHELVMLKFKNFAEMVENDHDGRVINDYINSRFDAAKIKLKFQNLISNMMLDDLDNSELIKVEN